MLRYMPQYRKFSRQKGWKKGSKKSCSLRSTATAPNTAFNLSVPLIGRLGQVRLAQASVEFVDDSGPVGIFDDFFLEKRSLRGGPERCPVEGGAAFQRAVGGDEAFNGCLVGGQSELGKQVTHGVQLGVHGKLLFLGADCHGRAGRKVGDMFMASLSC